MSCACSFISEDKAVVIFCLSTVGRIDDGGVSCMTGLELSIFIISPLVIREDIYLSETFRQKFRKCVEIKESADPPKTSPFLSYN
jgi:hypothetical protein